MSRIGPRIGIGARLLSIILLCVLLEAGITRGNFDDHNGSKRLATVRAHTLRPQPHQGGIQSDDQG